MVTVVRAARSGTEAEGLPRASVSLCPETTGAPRKLSAIAEWWFYNWGARQNGEGTWARALYFTGGETEARGGDRPTQDHKASQRQGPILLRPHSETMPGTVLEALQISMH